MTTNFPALLQGGQSANLPASLRNIMQQMPQSEMQENVNQSFGVVSIKGKVFSIKFGGVTTPLTINANGMQYAAPYFDVVLPKANGNLSKTYYKGGYVDGSEDSPDCWSEDGQFPMGPVEKRPIDPRTGTPCTSCAMCPMNQYGSRISDSGRKGKACADTRKVIVLPCVPTGQKDANGHDVTVMDHENIKFGGPMLLRVPAASLKVFAEYDRKLSEMGLSYFTVVTRMMFDTTEAFPKFVLQPVRVLTEQEGAHVAEIRESAHVQQMLVGVQANTPATAGPTGMEHLAGQTPPAALMAPPAPTPVPVQAAPQPAPLPVQNAPAPSPLPPPLPSNVVPMTAPAPPAPPAPTPAAPVATFPPVGWTAHPTSPGYFYAGQEVLTEAQLRERMAAQNASLVPPAPPAPPAAAPATMGAPQPVQVTQGTFSAVDSLLQG